MIYHAFLIKYAEIAIKGKNRYVFEDALVKQIRSALERVEGEFQVEKERGRIYVYCPKEYDYDEVTEALQKVFGIVEFCPVCIYEDAGFEQTALDVINYMKEAYPGFSKSFKVFTRRAKKTYPMTSMEVSAELGGRLLDAFPQASVDVHDPQFSLFVEIRDRIYVYSEMLKGPGGMPLGTNGRAMLLLSGGIDSPVAGYMVSKRGVVIEAVKNALHLFQTQTGGVGELTNFLMGSALVLPAGLIYARRKSRKTALIGCLVGSVSMGIVSAFANYFILLPMFEMFMPVEQVIAAFAEIVPFIHTKLDVVLYNTLPVNLCKGLAISLVTMVLYKHLSPLLKGKR